MSMEHEKPFAEPIPEELHDLLENESLDASLTFGLHEERDSEGRAIEGKAFWLKLRQEEEAAEGKLFLPPGASNDSLVLFEGGLPGDSPSWMEGKHTPAFLREGYSVLVMRHLGTKTDTEQAKKFIYSPERIARGGQTGQTAIGGMREFNLKEIAKEPAIALNALGGSFSRIVMVGHSAGALHNAYAMRELSPDVQERVQQFIALAGYLGDVDERKEQFADLKGYYDYCRRFINMGDPEANVALVNAIHERVRREGLPEHVMVTLINSPDDEYIPLTGAKRFQDLLGRGLRVIDETQSEPEFHDLKNLQPETLLRLAEMHYPQAKHAVTFREKNRRT